MAINAGQRITAGLLSADAGGTTLTNDTPAVVNTWEDWGTEVVDFADPGVPVRILASAFGRLNKSTAGINIGGIRILISLDGGSTFNIGTAPFGSVGDTAGVRAPISTGHVVSGTPTGLVRIKVQLNASSTAVDFMDGFLQAQLIPQN